MLLGIISLVASVSNTRSLLANSAEQIENGRYALEVLSDDISLAGFLGKYRASVASYKQPDPCLTAADPDALGFKHDFSVPNLPAPLMAFAAGDALPVCLSSMAVNDSEVLVVRHVEPIEVDATLIPNNNATLFFQVSGCDSDGKVFVFSDDPTDLILTENDCSTVAPAWEYISRAYFVSDCDDCTGDGDGIPTLKVLELAGGNLNTWSIVNGVEDIHYRYGLDLNEDATPDCYVDDPGASAAPAGCAVGPWDPADNWEDVVTIEINVLVRSLDASMSKARTVVFDLNRVDANGDAVVSKFGDRFRRGLYSTVVSIPNIAGVRE